MTPPVPTTLDEFTGYPTLTVDVNSPAGLFGTHFCDTNSFGVAYGVDAVIWCADDYCKPTEGLPGGDTRLAGVLAQLFVEPVTIPGYSGDLEFDVFYECSNHFTFSVNGKAPSIPGACSSSAGEVDATFIYAYANGSLKE